ncbi:hypothetical protein RYH80_08195 [Halobaculum sp. MBLA0147]|uniref:hypothetical protein n=1 Tax=Halobaculum sp. MBLA0147 TaxID=3079934 RepID=UPI003523E501
MAGDRPVLAQVDSFEQAAPAAAAAGTDTVAVAGRDGDVVLVDGEGHFTLQRADAVADVAVGGQVYTLADGAVTAFGTNGTRLWTAAEIDEPVGLAADPVGGTVLVRTADEAFVRVRGDSGTTVGRDPVPGAELPRDPHVAVYDGLRAVGRWSSLFVTDEDGEAWGEGAVSLDGAVADVGIVDETVVVALRDGSVAGYADGECRWERDGDVDWIADAGDGHLWVRDGERVVAIAPDGGGETVESVPHTGSHVVSVDGTVACRVADGTATVSHAVEDPAEELRLSVPDAPVPETADTVSVVVENGGDATVDRTVAVTGTGVTVGAEPFSLALEPGARQRVTVGVAEVADDTVSLGLVVDDERVAETTVETVDPDRTPTVTGTAVALVDGQVRVEVRLRNETETPVEAWQVGGVDGGAVQPGGERSVEATFAPPVTDPTVALAPFPDTRLDLDVPARPVSLALETDGDGYLTVRATATVDCPVRTELVVGGVPTPDDTVAREVEIPADGTVVWTLPSVAAGRRRVTVESDTATQQTTCDPGVVDAVARATGGERAERSGRGGRGASSHGGERGGRAGHDERRDGHPGDERGGGAAGGGRSATGGGRTEPGGGRADSDPRRTGADTTRTEAGAGRTEPRRDRAGTGGGRSERSADRHADPPADRHADPPADRHADPPADRHGGDTPAHGGSRGGAGSPGRRDSRAGETESRRTETEPRAGEAAGADPAGADRSDHDPPEEADRSGGIVIDAGDDEPDAPPARTPTVPEPVIDRTVSASEPSAGHRFRERLAVGLAEDPADPVDIAVTADEGERTGRVTRETDTSVPILDRGVVAFADGALPSAVAETDGGEAVASDHPVSVATPPVTPYVWLDGDGRLCVAVRPDAETGGRLTGVTLPDATVTFDAGFTPGEVVRETTTVPDPPTEPVPATVTCEVDGERRELETLSLGVRPDRGETTPVDVTAAASVGRYLYVTLDNEGDSPVEDVGFEVASDGTVVGREELGRVEPGDDYEVPVSVDGFDPADDTVVVHVVDTESDERLAAFELTDPTVDDDETVFTPRRRERVLPTVPDLVFESL